MRKIPTVLRRDPEDLRRVLPEVTPGCEWVLAGEGVATRKFDGTCVMLDEHGAWWARRVVVAGRQEPPGFVEVEFDETTGKTVGWEPIAQSPFAKWHRRALEAFAGLAEPRPGTYELCGPKVNGNPDRFEQHVLIEHATATALRANAGPITVAEIERLARTAGRQGFEGIVWHHRDGRMSKIKARDFPSES